MGSVARGSCDRQDGGSAALAGGPSAVGPDESLSKPKKTGAPTRSEQKPIEHPGHDPPVPRGTDPISAGPSTALSALLLSKAGGGTLSR